MLEPDICTCCYLRWAPERFSHTDKRPSVCVDCSRHVGNAEKRDQEHVRDWRAAQRATVTSYEGRLSNMRQSQDRYAAELASVRSAYSDALGTIASEFHRAPIGELRNALETELVADERGRAESAFRIRSRAMAVLWRVDRLHHALDGKSHDLCRCGLKVDRCQILETLAPFIEELDKWEAAEKERMRSGKTHGLPREHPDALKFMRDGHRDWRGPGRYEGVGRAPSTTWR